MEKKITAVQFLLSHIADEGKDMIGRDILEQAIQMERNQIEEAFKAALPLDDNPEYMADKYYKKTFNPSPCVNS